MGHLIEMVVLAAIFTTVIFIASRGDRKYIPGVWLKEALKIRDVGLI